MRIFTLMLILFNVLTFYNYSQTQSNLELKDNRALLRHHSRNEITEIQLKAPIEYQLLELYYTASFQVERIDCINCYVNFEELFNYDLFNIIEYEHLRKSNEYYSFIFKEKYRITLHSTSWLEASLNGYELSELLNFRPLREFPIWSDTGDDDLDYLNYSQARDEWILDFPEIYRTKTNAGSFKIIRFDEWKLMQPSKRDQLLNGTVEILIID